MPSQIIANTYEIREEIGAGGGGVVYLAWHLRLDKPVVLKADKRGLSVSLEKLRGEADALKSLHHTYIPQVYDFVVDSGNVYTVMDLIQGESFNKPLSRGERFPQATVVKWLRQLLEAVVYLHSRPPYGILHSDIKPANVMLTPAGDICLIDFNIALALGAEGAIAVGASRGYASPEHYGPDSLAEATGRKTAPVDPGQTLPVGSADSTILADAGVSSTRSKQHLLDVRSDIYGLGATVYHILSGTRPAAKAREVVPLSTADYSGGLVRILTKAMHPDPERRYQTAKEMLAAVNRLHKTDPRYRRQIRNRYLAGGVLSVLFLISGCSTFAGLKRMENIQSALTQAEYSANALAEGNTAQAISYALAALPQKQDLLTPPPTPQAQKALADALQVYDLRDGYQSAGTVVLPSPPLQIALSPNGETAAALCAYTMVLFVPETGEILARLPLVKSALAEAEFVGNNTLVYAGADGICGYDIAEGQILWQGKPATAIAVSADGQTIAAVDRDGEQAMLYTIDGKEKATIPFLGKRQRVPVKDTLGNPGDSLLALNRDGSLLAASFADGSLMLFQTASGEGVPVQQPCAATHFEGGFNGDYLAFSAMKVEGKSVFAVVDTKKEVQTGGFQSENPYGVIADESGIYISSENLVVKLHPVTGNQQEIAYLGTDVLAYAHGERDFIVAAKDNSISLFDDSANAMGQFEGAQASEFVKVGGEFAVAGGRNTPDLRILRRKSHSAATVFTYDADYAHDEARINSDGDRILLFSYQGFRLHDAGGALLCDTKIPDEALVYDQQYSPASGNLVVLYPNALRIYAGRDGSLLLEETGLQSVFYAPYGVSILKADGSLRLIDPDTAQPTAEAQIPQGSSFAALCGISVDGAFLGQRELIGAAKTADGYQFAVSDGVQGTVYSGEGKELFAFAAQGKSEAFFAGDVVVISPQHGTPIAYHARTGEKLRELQPDSYMTYMTQLNDAIISEYITTDGKRWGILLDDRCEIIAQLPGLTDISSGQLYFDYKTGYIRKTPIYSLKELIRIAEGE